MDAIKYTKNLKMASPVYKTVLLVTILLYVHVQTGLAQNVTAGQNIDTTGVPSTADDGDTKTAKQKAVAPVYKMANIFFESVIKPTNLSTLNSSVHLSDISAVLDSFQNDWQIWVKHYYAYVICLVFAVIYILAIPISGCVICGCRSRGKCGGKQDLMDGKRTKWYRRICTGLLLLFCVGLLFGVVCMFLTNEMLYEETEAAGLPNLLVESIDRLDRYIDVAGSSYSTYLDTELTKNMETLRNRLENLPGEVQKQVGELTGVGALMDTLDSYVTDLNRTRNNLLSIDTTVSDLGIKTTALTDKIDQLKSNITRDFSACSSLSTDCEQVMNISAALATLVSFSGLPSLASTAAEFAVPLSGSGSIYSSMADAQMTYNQVSDAVNDTSNDVINALSTESGDVISQIKSFLNESITSIKEISLDGVQASLSQSVGPNIEMFGKYRYYACIGLSTFVLLIVTLFCFGLLFGACGGQKGKGTECCNKNIAVSFFKVGLGFIFVLSWIVMLVIAVLFPIGGISHNEICRNLLLPPADVSSASVIDDVIVNGLGLPVSFLGLYEECNQDHTIYEALKLEQRGSDFNVSSLLNPNNYDVSSRLNELKAESYDPGLLTIVNAALKSNIAQLSEATDKIDLSSHSAELNKLITSQDLQDFADLLKNAADNSTTNADLLQFYADTVQGIQDGEYTAVNDQANALRDLVASVDSFKNVNGTEVIITLEGVQGDVTITAMTSAVGTVTDTMYDDFVSLLDDAATSIRSYLARCGPLANIISTLVDNVCVDILQPFNAFWFSTGWCLVFFIFIIPMGIILMDMYKKQFQYDGSMSDDDATSTNEPFSNDHRQNSDRSRYRGRPLPDPMSTETRPGRVPYEQLPVVSGARSSPLPNARYQDHSNGWDRRPRGDSRPGNQRSHEGQWNNLAYDDTSDNLGYQWSTDRRDQDISSQYRGAMRDPYWTNKHEPSPDYTRGQDRSNRRTMYPDDNRW